MRIKAEQLPQYLEKHLAPLYTIFGNEPLLVIEATDLIRKKARKQGFTEQEIFVIDNTFRWPDLLNTCNNPSLFGEQKLIDVRLPTGKPGREGGKVIEDYCRALPQNKAQESVTLITLPKMDKQSQSTKWFKAIENAGIMIPIYAIEHMQLPEWIKQRLAMQNQTTDTDTLRFMASKVEGNLLAAHQEIQKMALLYPQGQLSFEQVKNAILDVARYDVFQLSEAMVAAHPVRYTRILAGLHGEGTAPPLILAALAEQIRQLITIRKGLDQGLPPGQLLKTARVWGNRQNIMLSAAKRMPVKRLLQSLVHAAKIDRMIKGVAPDQYADTWEELLQLGLNIASSDNTLPVSTP